MGKIVELSDGEKDDSEGVADQKMGNKITSPAGEADNVNPKNLSILTNDLTHKLTNYSKEKNKHLLRTK